MQKDSEFYAMWCESESSLDPEALEMFGIDKERFYYFEVGTYGGEKALDLIIKYAQLGVDMIVINSLKCLTPAIEFIKNMGEDTVATQARMNAKFMRVIIPTIAESGTALCAIQHMSTNIGGYGNGHTIVGGLAIKYNNVLTVEFSKVFMKSDHALFAVRDQYMLIKSRIVKNHCKTLVNPYQELTYTVKIGTGTDVTGEIIEAAINQKIVVKGGGGWFREYNDGIEEKNNERILEDGTKCAWRGMGTFNDFVNNNPSYFEYLKERVSGNIVTNDLSDDEIDEINDIQDIEEEALAQLEEEIERVINEQ